MSEDWLAIEESLSENLVASTLNEEGEESSLSSSSASLSVSSSSKHSPSGHDRSPGNYRLDMHVSSSTVVALSFRYYPITLSHVFCVSTLSSMK